MAFRRYFGAHGGRKIGSGIKDAMRVIQSFALFPLFNRIPSKGRWYLAMDLGATNSNVLNQGARVGSCRCSATKLVGRS